jgi:hypothetical protein
VTDPAAAVWALTSKLIIGDVTTANNSAEIANL